MLYCFQEVNHINRRHTRWCPTKWMILRFLMASDMELHLALKNSNQQLLLFLTASFLIIYIQREFDALAKWAAKGWLRRLSVSPERTVHDDLQQNKQTIRLLCNSIAWTRCETNQSSCQCCARNIPTCLWVTSSNSITLLHNTLKGTRSDFKS